MEDVFKTIPSLIDDADAPAELREALVVATWKKAAGDTLSAHAVATGLNGGTLRIAVRDEVWKRHLESLASQMIFKINSLLRSPAVTYIEFYVDEERVKLEGTPGPESVPEKVFRREAERCRTEIPESVLDKIHDPELRQLFLDAASNCIARHNLMIERGQIEPEVDFTIED